MNITNPERKDSNKAKMAEWFDGLLNHINTDRLMLETDVASTETKNFWNTAINGDHDTMSKNIRAETTQYFIKNLVQFYFKELTSFEVSPQKLAFDFSDAKILVWAQIADDDIKAEKALILSEAKSNSKFSENGFFVSTTIVEECDNLIIPPHYHEVKIHGRSSSSR